eukprot:PLAT11605.13.p1 GENE.PLAT11605.13~~PLAT11605.13.p1  ORF type:complete len:1036 (-),score=355.94 PLAT11605.13:868-3975(-)
MAAEPDSAASWLASGLEDRAAMLKAVLTGSVAAGAGGRPPPMAAVSEAEGKRPAKAVGAWPPSPLAQAGKPPLVRGESSTFSDGIASDSAELARPAAVSGSTRDSYAAAAASSLPAFPVHLFRAELSGLEQSKVKQWARTLRRPPEERTEEELQAIDDFGSLVEFFANLSLSQRLALYRVCSVIKLLKDEVLFEQGDFGDEFFVVMTGSVDVRIRLDQTSDVSDLKKISGGGRDSRGQYTIKTLGPPQSFGEIALHAADRQRRATVVAAELTVLMKISKTNYDAALRKWYRDNLERKRGLVFDHPLFRGCSEEKKEELLRVMRTRSYANKAVIYAQDSFNSDFFILLKGGARMLRRCRVGSHSRIVELAELRPGDVFGEEELLGAQLRRRSSIVTTRSGTDVLVVSREAFFTLVLCDHYCMPILQRFSCRTLSSAEVTRRLKESQAWDAEKATILGGVLDDLAVRRYTKAGAPYRSAPERPSTALSPRRPMSPRRPSSSAAAAAGSGSGSRSAPPTMGHRRHRHRHRHRSRPHSRSSSSSSSSSHMRSRRHGKAASSSRSRLSDDIRPSTSAGLSGSYRGRRRQQQQQQHTRITSSPSPRSSSSASMRRHLSRMRSGVGDDDDDDDDADDDGMGSLSAGSSSSRLRAPMRSRTSYRRSSTFDHGREWRTAPSMATAARIIADAGLDSRHAEAGGSWKSAAVEGDAFATDVDAPLHIQRAEDLNRITTALRQLQLRRLQTGGKSEAAMLSELPLSQHSARVEVTPLELAEKKLRALRKAILGPRRKAHVSRTASSSSARRAVHFTAKRAASPSSLTPPAASRHHRRRGDDDGSDDTRRTASPFGRRRRRRRRQPAVPSLPEDEVAKQRGASQRVLLRLHHVAQPLRLRPAAAHADIAHNQLQHAAAGRDGAAQQRAAGVAGHEARRLQVASQLAQRRRAAVLQRQTAQQAFAQLVGQAGQVDEAVLQQPAALHGRVVATAPVCRRHLHDAPLWQRHQHNSQLLTAARLRAVDDALVSNQRRTAGGNQPGDGVRRRG